LCGVRPSISLTMIVRDEAADLPACLASVRPLVDEMIVVDTGSRDGTREVARDHGASVFEFAWRDDFAAARNFALDQATTDWALWLDADEVLHAVTPDATWREVGSVPAAVCFLVVPIFDRLPDGGRTLYRRRRIFRRVPEVRWYHPIHEGLRHVDDGPHREAAARTLHVVHHGFADPDARRARGKNERNVSILERELAARPDDADVLYFLARERLALGDFTGVIETARRGIAVARTPGLREALAAAAVRAAIGLRQPARAAEMLSALPGPIANPELCYLLGCALQEIGDLAGAERMLEQARAQRDAAVPYPIDADAAGWKSLQELGAIAWARGHLDAALAHWQQAHAEAPDQPAPNLLLFRALVETGQAQEAYERLDALTREQPAVASYWEALGAFLIEAEEWLAAADTLGRAVERHELPRLYRLLGIALGKLGRREDAANAELVAARLERRRG
jgi:tetratricopeptide (TPR) repeat protein